LVPSVIDEHTKPPPIRRQPDWRPDVDYRQIA
jgi:hypothetical protein